MTGPTASGKTELLDSVFGRGASSFFTALHASNSPSLNLPLSASVISADSMQAYRGMDIGTAKPDSGLLERLPHYLLDIKDPDEQYTAGEFVRLADSICASLAGKNSVPILSGGTGFYLRNFICGAPLAPPSDPSMREEVGRDLASRGAAALRGELEAADPASAARIGEHDLYRLTRAVEILRTSGLAPSCFAPSNKPRSEYDFLIIGMERPRAELKERIHARVGTMFAAGLAGEVAALRAAGYGPTSPGLKAIGYGEFFEMEGSPLSDIATAIELHTLQYAKRQMTFLRALPGIVWIGADPAELSSIIMKFLSAIPR